MNEALMNEELRDWLRENKIKTQLSDEECDGVMKRLAYDIVAGLPIERQISYASAERVAEQERQRRLTRRREMEQKQQREQEARRLEQERLVAQDLYDRFVKANPFATQGQIEKLWPALWEAEMLRRMAQPNAPSVEAQARDPRYDI